MFRSPWHDLAVSAPMQHLLGCGRADEVLAAAPGEPVRVNGRPIDADEQRRMAELQRELGFCLLPGSYWYDDRSGAFGRAGGATAGFLPAGLRFGGPMHAQCSSGGTEVFVNGREVHAIDLRTLEQVAGPIDAGRYRLDLRGDVRSRLCPAGGPDLATLLVPEMQPTTRRSVAAA